MDFWRHLKQLFQQNEAQNCPEMASFSCKEAHGLIQRSTEELAHFQAWLQSPWPQDMLHWIADSYREYRQTKAHKDRALGFLCLPSMNGFVLSYDANRWDSEGFFHFFDYLKHRLLALGYRSHLSDFKTQRNEQGKMVTTQRHYLKPPRKPYDAPDGPMEQLYGNIMICMEQVNEKIVQLKFSATHYHDRAYLPARDFACLLQDLLEP